MKSRKKKSAKHKTSMLKSITVNKIIIFIFLTVFFFTYGFISGHKKIFPYNEIKAVYYFGIKQIMFLKSSGDATKFDGFKICDLPILRKVPNGAIAVIGHAYGSRTPYRDANPNDYLAQSVEKFLIKNSNKISKVIFSGDVFAFPTISKWEKLIKNSKNKYEIYIAPGNHDIMSSSSEDIFNQSKFGEINYPYLIKQSNSTIILENSVKTNWNVSPETIKIINTTNNNESILIVRHNIPIKELKPFSNRAVISKDFLSYFDLKNKINKKSNITWIVGDSGAFSSLPRLKCLIKNNHRFILNGIGEVFGDRIILISNEKLFVYIL